MPVHMLYVTISIHEITKNQMWEMKGKSMELTHLNPYLRYAKLQKNVSPKPIPKLCYDCRLFFVIGGYGSFDINGEPHTFETNSAIFLPPGTAYTIHRQSSHISFYVVNFDLSIRYTHIEKPMATPTPAASDKSKILAEDAPPQFAGPFVLDSVNLPKQLIEICQLFQTREHFYKERSSALFKLCLLDLIHQSHKDSNSILTLQVLDYIYANYAVTTLNNQSIAEHFGYHPYHIGHVVKEITGKSLHQHLVEHRLSIAMDLLTATDYDIKTISWKTGFSSVSYFIQAFRSKLGMTPLEYRKKL